MEEDPGGSPACFAHLLVDGQPVDPETARDVATFRKAERARLMQRRRSISTPERATMTETLCKALDEFVLPQPDMRIAVYWPIRGEPDLRGWMERAHAAGATVLLPVVIEKTAPLIFREWSPGCAMERGIWNIPVPAGGGNIPPDVVVSPLLGVDDACFRLGNGGGYYDRTLAALAALDPLPRVIGVSFPDCRIPTIFPMPWDIPMHVVVLADGSVRHRPLDGARRSECGARDAPPGISRSRTNADRTGEILTKLDVIDKKIMVNAAELVPLLDLDPDEFRRRMQAGEIAILSESGEGEDEGRFRVTFRANRWKVRLNCAADGTVLTRVRARTGP